MKSNTKLEFIADVIILDMIFEILLLMLGPRFFACFLLICALCLFAFAGYVLIDTRHIDTYPYGDGLEGGWDGMQYWYWDQIDKAWVPESEIVDIITSENRVTDERVRRYKLSESERSSYLKFKYYGGIGFNKYNYVKNTTKEIKVVVPVKTGKEIWEERKKELKKEEEIKKQEKIDSQVEQWRKEAREKLNS